MMASLTVVAPIAFGAHQDRHVGMALRRDREL
jgi:hypothetical protein